MWWWQFSPLVDVGWRDDLRLALLLFCHQQPPAVQDLRLRRGSLHLQTCWGDVRPGLWGPDLSHRHTDTSGGGEVVVQLHFIGELFLNSPWWLLMSLTDSVTLTYILHQSKLRNFFGKPLISQLTKIQTTRHSNRDDYCLFLISLSCQFY